MPLSLGAYRTEIDANDFRQVPADAVEDVPDLLQHDTSIVPASEAHHALPSTRELSRAPDDSPFPVRGCWCCSQRTWA